MNYAFIQNELKKLFPFYENPRVLDDTNLVLRVRHGCNSLGNFYQVLIEDSSNCISQNKNGTLNVNIKNVKYKIREFYENGHTREYDIKCAEEFNNDK